MKNFLRFLFGADVGALKSRLDTLLVLTRFVEPDIVQTETVTRENRVRTEFVFGHTVRFLTRGLSTVEKQAKAAKYKKAV